MTIIDADKPVWLIWSNEHRAWWRAESCGYTVDIAEAGRYTLAQGLYICAEGGTTYRDRGGDERIPAEVLVLSPEAIETEMSDWKLYQRSAVPAQMRKYKPGEDVTRISISEEDRKNGSPKAGDMIARDPSNHNDQWLVNADYFAAKFDTEPLNDG
jgi:hypothetical protein